jgi:hypothetical protein
MSWAKRNLYFLVSGIVALVLLLAAGWYAYSSWQSNSDNGAKLKENYDKLRQFAIKNPNPGNDVVTNIDTAKEQTKAVQERVAQMQKFFTPVPGIPNTNKIDERMLSRAVRDTIGQLRASAQSHSVTLPVGTPEFAFSFTLQAGKISYDPGSTEMLSKQLGEVKTICETLFAARVSALSSVQRERTADDMNLANTGGVGAGANDYCDSTSVTNENVVITPYQVTFDCFTPELGNVLASFANQQHTVIVKTLNLQPADLTSMPMDAPGMGGMQAYTGYGNQVAPTTRAGGLPTAVDEKKLRVTMQVDFVKILPTQGR